MNLVELELDETLTDFEVQDWIDNVFSIQYPDIKARIKKGCSGLCHKKDEWHYVKDGDLPTEDLRQRTRGYYLTASKYKWHKWFIFDVAYFTGVIFIKGGAILDSAIAWREIVPPIMQ